MGDLDGLRKSSCTTRETQESELRPRVLGGELDLSGEVGSSNGDEVVQSLVAGSEGLELRGSVVIWKESQQRLKSDPTDSPRAQMRTILEVGMPFFSTASIAVGRLSG